MKKIFLLATGLVLILAAGQVGKAETMEHGMPNTMGTMKEEDAGKNLEDDTMQKPMNGSMNTMGEETRHHEMNSSPGAGKNEKTDDAASTSGRTTDKKRHMDKPMSDTMK